VVLQARAAVAPLELWDGPGLRRGDSVWLVGLTKGLRTMQRRSTVTNAASVVNIPAAEVPRFRAVHEEVGQGRQMDRIDTQATGRQADEGRTDVFR
jgi:hypothetical protein